MTLSIQFTYSVAAAYAHDVAGVLNNMSCVKAVTSEDPETVTLTVQVYEPYGEDRVAQVDNIVRQLIPDAAQVDD